MSWPTLQSETNFANDHLAVVTEEVRTPTRVKRWTTVRRKRAVVVAAFTAENRIVLVQQERIPVRTAVWEMPAGQIDEEEDEPAVVARRELLEETGYELAAGGEMIPLGDLFSSPGFTDERQFLFVARPVSRQAEKANGEEAIVDCREFTADEITRMIAENTIRDANTLSVWARLRARKLID